jgi:hypothetical protein
MARRDAILTGISRAAELHRDLRLRQLLKDGSRPVDVLAISSKLAITILFRPLGGLLGAYVPTPRAAGMLLTTQRDHHVQRFTAAHELGHHVLEHRTMSLDVNVGYAARGERNGYDEQELEADSFAAEFLLPAWLIAAQARRQRWGKSDLQKPEVVYQLSLRMGASYTATCWALNSAQFITRSTAERLAGLEPQVSKKEALRDIRPANWYPDVWLLSERDQGAELLGGPDDFLIFSLEEHVSGGYEWDLPSAQLPALAVRRDTRLGGAPAVMGGTVTRQMVVQSSQATRVRLRLQERRPWEEGEGAAINSLELDLTLLGKEPAGLPRRERLLAA